MKNIHLISTNSSSKLVKIKDNLFYTTTKNIPGGVYQHMYITNDEKNKKGNWCLLDDNVGQSTGYSVLKCLEANVKDGEYDFEDERGLFYTGRCEKIILTTDPELIKDNVQAIDDEFLEWFVNNSSCDKVNTIIEYKDGYGNWFKYDKEFWDKQGNKPKFGTRYKIIIPKEEPKLEWTPTQGEQVWIKVFSNWSKGTYIGYDTTKSVHLVRENEEGGGNLLSSSKILPYKSMPNEPKKETLEEAAEQFANSKKWMDEGVNNWVQHTFKEGAKSDAAKVYWFEIFKKEYIDTLNGN